MPPPVALTERHVEEILLRVPSHNPAVLFRAALVCKRWRRLVCSAAFQRRYLEFHRPNFPPMMGFAYNGVADNPLDDGFYSPRHFSIFSPRPQTAFCWPQAGSWGVRALDARHGRFLFQPVEVEVEVDNDNDNAETSRHRKRQRLPGEVVAARRLDRLLFQNAGAPVEGARDLYVSVPMTKRRWDVPVPTLRPLRTLAAAVLCADTTGACDHLDCYRGPFLVVFVAYHSPTFSTLVYTYSSETAAWSDPISARREVGTARVMPSVYIGNALYFAFRSPKSILKYDLHLRQISWIQLPSMCNWHQPNVLITTEGGVLGVATIRGSVLYVWSRKQQDAPAPAPLPQGQGDDDHGWTRTKVLELSSVLTLEDRLALRQPRVVGFADGIGLIFFWANGSICSLHLKSRVMKKFSRGKYIYAVFPYMTFCTPALAADSPGDGPSGAGGSSA